MKLTSLTRNIALATTALAAIYMLNSCSSEDERVAPLKTEIESSVKAAIPPFLALEDLETEVIPVVENRVKINFKAKVKPMEDLYISDRYLNGDRSLMILNKSQANGKEANLYGFMFAERTMDKWDISRPDIQSGMAQLGSPRGSFDARAMIDGSDEMKKFFADREEARLDNIRQAEEAAQRAMEAERKSEEARFNLLEENRANEEARRKKLIDATAVGKTYEGFASGNNSNNRGLYSIVLKFTSQSGVLITAEISDPENPTHKQELKGELVFDPKVRQMDGEYYPILLTTKEEAGNQEGRSDLFNAKYILMLDFTEHGMEGLTKTSKGKYVFRLQGAK